MVLGGLGSKVHPIPVLTAIRFFVGQSYFVQLFAMRVDTGAADQPSALRALRSAAAGALAPPAPRRYRRARVQTEDPPG